MARSIKFYAEKRKDKTTGEPIKKNVPILFSFTFDGCRYKSTTGERAETINQWSEPNQKFKGSASNSAEKNQRLEQIAAKLEKIYLDAVNEGITPNLQYIKNKVKEKQQKETETVFDALDNFVSEQKIKNSWTHGTVKRFTVVRNKLHEFEIKQGKGYKIEFNTIDENFFNAYLKFLLDKGYLNSYVKKNIKLLEWFLNWCKTKGYPIKYDYSQFKFKGNTPKPGTNIRPLTIDQLFSLYKLPIQNIRLSQVRDVFCFSCFTGLRHSDLLNLKKADIDKSKEFFTLTTIKTHEPLYIPLVSFAREILQRYENTFSKLAIPVISQQKYNTYLKELGELAGFNDEMVSVNYSGNERQETQFKKWERLTSHVGRQTFITNAIFLGMPGEVVKDITGQSSDEMLKMYYKILDEQKRSEMGKFDTYQSKNNSA